MKLYSNPYACSLAVVIAATEAGVPLDLIQVDILKDPHTLPDGSLYADAVTPKNYVPMLVLDDGSTIGEVSVLLQLIADMAPQSGLAPAASSPERYRLQEWLNFISSELHKFFSPWLFHPETGEVAQAYAKGKINGRFRIIDDHLATNAFVFGDRFSVADAYLFTMVNWTGFTKIDLTPYPHLSAWFARIGARPAVKDAIAQHSGKPVSKLVAA
jgi:glutathione S-transferase